MHHIMKGDIWAESGAKSPRAYTTSIILGRRVPPYLLLQHPFFLHSVVRIST
jgi:hypothetical protein